MEPLTIGILAVIILAVVIIWVNREKFGGKFSDDVGKKNDELAAEINQMQ